MNISSFVFPDQLCKCIKFRWFRYRQRISIQILQLFMTFVAFKSWCYYCECPCWLSLDVQETNLNIWLFQYWIKGSTLIYEPCDHKCHMLLSKKLSFFQVTSLFWVRSNYLYHYYDCHFSGLWVCSNVRYLCICKIHAFVVGFFSHKRRNIFIAFASVHGCTDFKELSLKYIIKF